MVLSGTRPHAYEDLVKPVILLNAIHDSYRAKKTVEVNSYE